MATIGTFTSTDNGFTGTVRTLALNAKAKLVRVENPSDKRPHFRILRVVSSWERLGRRPPGTPSAITSRSSWTTRASRLRSTSP
ncbi:hypothetical protein ACVWXO_009363 [Bradyrhizobium sp. LM2.7]